MAGFVPLQPLDSLDSLENLGSQAASTAGSAASAAVNVATGGLVGSGPIPGPTQIVMIILGLIFIVAGLFSFDKTRDLVVKAGKAAAATAAVA